MRVTVVVENGDQQVEVTRTGADVVAYGSTKPLNSVASILDLAVADARRACELPEPGQEHGGDRISFDENDLVDEIVHTGRTHLEMLTANAAYLQLRRAGDDEFSQVEIVARNDGRAARLEIGESHDGLGLGTSEATT